MCPKLVVFSDIGFRSGQNPRPMLGLWLVPRKWQVLICQQGKALPGDKVIGRVKARLKSQIHALDCWCGLFWVLLPILLSCPILVMENGINSY